MGPQAHKLHTTPAPGGHYDYEYHPETRDAIDAAIEQLSNETDTAKQSEVYRAWLSAISRSYHYSIWNQLLIWSQVRTRLGSRGFHTWKDLGRWVKKGENGIRILAPIVRKLEHEQDVKAVPTSKLTGFRSVIVFERLSRDLRPGFYSPV